MNDTTGKTSRLSVEFIMLVAFLNACAAISIDAMLPAVGQMARELGAENPNSRQFIITTFFAGLMIGTLVYGPWSDSLGRKPAIIIGLIFYSLGSLVCLISESFGIMLVGRLLQGFGAAAPRYISIAMVRDRYSGAAMSRVMSFVILVFLLVPMLSPGIGQLVLLIANWRVIFVAFLVCGVLSGIWLWCRQEETLVPANRRPFSVAALVNAAGQVLGNPIAMGYTMASGLNYGIFIIYLNTSQQILAEEYAQGAYFPLWFAFFASGFALAMVVNAKLVNLYGMQRLSSLALRMLVFISVLFLGVCLGLKGHPPLWALAAFLFTGCFFSGVLLANFNAIIMEPLKSVAGMGAAISGTLSSAIAILCGGCIGLLYRGTVIPLVAGFAGLSTMALVVILLTARRIGKVTTVQ
jgi:DHA1 family bicyclomycin/chloramphenicol resistance-like MFS transporter